MTFDEIKNQILDSPPFKELRDRVSRLNPSEFCSCRGICGSLLAFVGAAAFQERASQVLLLVPGDDHAEKLRDDLVLLLGEPNVRWLGRSINREVKLLDMSGPIAQVETLRSLSDNQTIVVVSSASAFVSRVPSPTSFRGRSINLKVKTEYSFEQLIDQLTQLEFERKDFVEEYGDFAIRGGILDIFPFVGENPIRLEFWGNHLESVREFEVLSQRSVRDLQSASIIASLSEEDHDDTISQKTESESVLSFLQHNALVIINEPASIEQEINELIKEGARPIHSWDSIKTNLAGFARVVHSMLGDSLGASIHFNSAPQPPSNGSMKILMGHIRGLKNAGFRVIISSDTKEESQRIRELLDEESAAPEPVEPGSNLLKADVSCDYLEETVHSGFVYETARIALLTEHEIFGRLRRRGGARRTKFKGMSQKELLQLRRGDFVVHADYGIGSFAGLQKIKVRGAEQEVIKVLYEGNDVLYVNLNFVNRIQKYSSHEGHTPKRSVLGSPDWDRLKSRARKKIKTIARDLITLYARRKHEKGFAFASDTHWQKEMEASFIYEDTPDQATATADVKKDMEAESPMDRLVCGDVGFGKTEVAVRSAFKAAMNGKQTAVLVPTTILAEQHFHTFVDRVGRYALRVESLSRFKTPGSQKRILNGLKEGQVDVIIGTHRLLSKDVQFKNLGLLVIDEEHRFGVAAKEKLRQLRATVDTLTLTATPIPRTLQFSLLGARDLSIINTPPRNRLPIVTEIATYDLELAREAILHEIHRGGQVYFIHDRIQNMDEMRTVLEERVPEARFHVAHGQMKGHQLEKTMLDFLEKKFDVLLCTKIIESGIDIPSVNTIIIHRADRFGLAELYQLRGRVGRSNIQAYAYLFTPALATLPRQTLRRLQAIQEFTELGSGFNLAMRDLEIRGAGNLLGGEQSGFIADMGFEMYQRVVEEAVGELKDEEFKGLFASQEKAQPVAHDTTMETDIEAFIPDIYVESDTERLDIYRRMYGVRSLEDVIELRNELRDRFGEYPPEVENLFLIVELKLTASRLLLAKVDLDGETVSITLPPSDSIQYYEDSSQGASPFQTLMTRISMRKEFQTSLRQRGKQLLLTVSLTPGAGPRDRLKGVGNFLRGLEEGT